MMKTESVKIPAGTTRQLATSGLWFRLRNLAGGDDPYMLLTVTSVKGSQLAYLLEAINGDRFDFPEPFKEITFNNPTAADITVDVLSSHSGGHQISNDRVEVTNFPEFAGGSKPATADVTVPANSVAPVLLIAANVNRRSVKFVQHEDNDPTAKALRLGSQGTVGANSGDPLGYGGVIVDDCTGAIYAWNRNAAIDLVVCISEILNP